MSHILNRNENQIHVNQKRNSITDYIKWLKHCNLLPLTCLTHIQCLISFCMI